MKLVYKKITLMFIIAIPLSELALADKYDGGFDNRSYGTVCIELRAMNTKSAFSNFTDDNLCQAISSKLYISDYRCKIPPKSSLFFSYLTPDSVNPEVIVSGYPDPRDPTVKAILMTYNGNAKGGFQIPVDNWVTPGLIFSSPNAGMITFLSAPTESNCFTLNDSLNKKTNFKKG